VRLLARCAPFERRRKEFVDIQGFAVEMPFLIAPLEIRGIRNIRRFFIPTYSKISPEDPRKMLESWRNLTNTKL
jgi:hypothetical protein